LRLQSLSQHTMARSGRSDHATRAFSLPPAAPDTPCPVCGGPDSGTHIMGGCRHVDMQRLYINRHNHGLLSVAEAVSRGCHGAGYMVLDATAPPTRNHYQPTLFCKRPPKVARKRHTVYIVEFGCCEDLNHEKVAEKTQQHAQLAARVLEAPRGRLARRLRPAHHHHPRLRGLHPKADRRPPAHAWV
jgi:hypothetical protein